MRQIAMMAGLALAVAAVPAASEAACKKRTTGTVVGALTGGLLGNVVAGRGDRTEGTLIGAAAGGLIGNQVSKCNNRRYTRSYAPRRAAYRQAAYAPPRQTCRYETRVYYDPYGQPVYAPQRICG